MASFTVLVAILMFAIQASVTAKPYYGKEIGQFTTRAHLVSGTVYAVDESTIMIRGFNYDGTAPDAFLWVGTTDEPSSSGQELFLDASETKLGPYDDADLVVSLPMGTKITDFKWLSVWCRSFAANFGEVYINASFELPAPHDMGPLMGVAHDVDADRVWILDSNTILFVNLFYDGNGPDAYFWAGDTDEPDENGIILTWREGNDQVIPRAFTGENITVTIPQPRTIYDLTHIGLWCKLAKQDFGHLKINPSELNVPAVVIKEEMGYYGKLIGHFVTLAHDVEGVVYAMDQSRIMLREFNYDGTAPDAFLWVGTTNLPSPDGMPLYLDDSQEKLGAYENGVIIVQLPEGSKITDYKWLSVWCRDFTVNFGYVNISADLELPDKHDLGPLPTIAHDVKADNVYVLDAKTFLFVNFFYDGTGPDSYFWVGNTVSPDENGFALKWQMGDDQMIPQGRAFDGENVTAHLPGDKTVFDITYVGVWCHLAKADFGHIKFNPQILNVPAVPDMDDMPDEFPNCAVMIDDEFHASWMVTGSLIRIQLSGRVGKGQYLAFGLSGSETRTLMDGSDVAVVWEREDGTAGVVDYNLQSKQQCTVGNNGERVGACEDTVAGGVNNVDFVAYSQVEGIRHFTYSRLLSTGDSIDKDIPTDQEVYISWAIGSINPDGRVAKHTKVPFEDVKLNFGSASSSCPAFTARVTSAPDMPGWPKQRLNNVQEFRVEIGQNGGKRGYESITGQVGWGIAWYVNGLLIPEIYVVRGVNYTFTVYGGNDPVLSAKYHPFYITNDTIGGYAQQSEEEKKDVAIYSGPHTGPYCEWKVRVPGTSPDTYNSFPEYKDSLELECEDPAAEGTTFYWTPDDSTPDLIYYHCYTHRFLGWKIHVNNNPVTLLPTGGQPTTKKPTVTKDTGAGACVTVSVVLIIAALFASVLF